MLFDIYFALIFVPPGAETEWGNLIKRPLVCPPEITSGVMPYSPISNLCSEQLIKMMLKPQLVNNPASLASLQQMTETKVPPPEEAKTLQATINQKPRLRQSENITVENQSCSQICPDQAGTINASSSKMNVPEKPNPQSKCEKQTPAETNSDNLKSEPGKSTEQLNNLTSTADCNAEKLSASPVNPPNLINQLAFHNQNQGLVQLQTSVWSMQSQLESAVLQAQQNHVPPSDSTGLNGLLPVLDPDEWMSHTCNSLAGMYNRSPGPLPMFGPQDPSMMLPEVINPPLPLPGQEMWDHQLNNLRFLSQVDPLTSFTQQDPCSLNSSGLRDLSDESNNQSGIYSCLNIDVSNNGGSTMIDHSVSSAILDEFCTLKDANFQNPSDCLMNNFSSSQDVQSQITSASLADSQAFSLQDLPDNSGGTSSSNVDFDESSLLQNTSWQQVAPPVRTYTKVIKF